jgi:hypothetical protein
VWKDRRKLGGWHALSNCFPARCSLQTDGTTDVIYRIEKGWNLASVAVYFPFGHPGESLIKRALLTWDHVEVVGSRPPTCKHMRGDFVEAWELVCRLRKSTDEERVILRERLKQVRAGMAGDNPRKEHKWLGIDDVGYMLIDEKPWFNEETANLLFDLGMVFKDSEGRRRIHVRTLKGVIGLEAEVLAGVAKQQITDDLKTYDAYCELIANPPHNQYDFNLNTGEDLTSVALETVDLRNISLRKLIDFRKREAQEPTLGELRKKFAEDLTSFLRLISRQKSLTESDWKQIQYDYREDVRRDIAALSAELHCETTSFLLSKSLFVPLVSCLASLLPLLAPHPEPAIVGATALASGGLTGAAIAISQVLSDGKKAISERAKIIGKHPLAYMYELKHSC